MHDYEAYPELSNAQLAEFGFSSPHTQITEDFEAVVEDVTDGDTINVTCSFRSFKFPVRFLDYDAPEMNQGGEKAKQWLSSRVLGKRVFVLIDRSNRVGKYGRLLGRVMHNGIVLAEEMFYLGLNRPFGMIDEGQLARFQKITRLNQWFT